MFFTKRVLIYTTFKYEEYLNTAGKLMVAGIRYQTKSRNNLKVGYDILPMSFRDNIVQYDIYVKKNDEYKAIQALHDKL